MKHFLSASLPSYNPIVETDMRMSVTSNLFDSELMPMVVYLQDTQRVEVDDDGIGYFSISTICR